MTTEHIQLPDHAELTTDQARQGETGHGVRYVLIAGTALAVLALGIAAIFAL